MQAEVAELLPQVGGEQVVAVDLGGARRDLVGGEVLHVSRSMSMVSPRSKLRPGRWGMATLLILETVLEPEARRILARRPSFGPQRGAMSKTPVPFSLHVADEDIADLRARLARTRFPDQAPGDAWQFGTDVAYLRNLVEYWQTGFDWRAQEAALNAFPQFKVGLHGIDLHFLHVPGNGPAPMLPLLLCTAGPVRCSSSSKSFRA